MAAVDDVLDQHHVLAENLLLDVLQEHGRSVRFRSLAIGGDAHEIDLVRDGDRLHEVGDEHDAAVQDADEQGTGVGVIARDLLPHLADPPLDVRRADQNFHWVGLRCDFGRTLASVPGGVKSDASSDSRCR
jgi:hypothetical protein